MEQEFKTITATALATDLGEFTAIAAAWTVDREKDQIHPGAFAGTIKHWRRSGKQLPLHWDHKGGPENVIGHIDPQSMRETEEGLLVKGKLDIENSDMAKEAWRLVKSGTVGLSFGYLIRDGGETKRADGGRNLSDLDVFEISVTPAPMNPDTRIISAKAMAAEMSPEDLLAGMIEMAQAYIASPPDAEDADEMRQILDDIRELVADVDDAADMAEDATGKALREIIRELKATWTTAYVNNLPDSAFLYIEPGGSQDSDNKTTPRSLRHFPVKDATGAVDLPHVRNALARIPQSSLSQSVKDAATAKAQRLLNAQKSVPAGQIPADPDRRRIEQAVLDIQSDGASSRKSPPPVEEKHEAQAPPEDQLRRQTRDQYLEILTSTRSW